MTDAPVIHIGENSPEHVAYRLLQDIARVEQRDLYAAKNAATREWILKTYAQCRGVVAMPKNVDLWLERGPKT